VLSSDHVLVGQQLNDSVSSTAQIVFFLIGAMTTGRILRDLNDRLKDRLSKSGTDETKTHADG
jgi:hypothetical protein